MARRGKDNIAATLGQRSTVVGCVVRRGKKKSGTRGDNRLVGQGGTSVPWAHPRELQEKSPQLFSTIRVGELPVDEGLRDGAKGPREAPPWPVACALVYAYRLSLAL